MDPHLPSQFAEAPAWSLFLGNFGRWSVNFALIMFVTSTILSLTNSQLPVVAKARRAGFYLGCFGLVVTFVALATLFIKDQFQFRYIFNHSGAENPISYKIASVWTAQQGSFLLWAVLSALLGAIAIKKTGVYERAFTGAYCVFLGVLTFILFNDTPFKLLDDVVQNGKVVIPPVGQGMVPGLQNYWVIIHPPIVFLGFASLTIPFAYGVAALFSRNYDDWAKQSRGSTIFGMSVLGLGISLGGLWAYETQGWGGFWGWDPVENVSLVPWLFLVALSHGVIVQSAKGIWKSANLLLAGLPFLSFVYGTFLTRSGLLDKVSNHSFASMDEHSKIVLRYYLLLVFVAYIAVWIWRTVTMPKAEAAQTEQPGYNRTSFYQLGSLSICLMAFVISIGMSWPVIKALNGGEGERVEPNVYHQAVVWFFIGTMIAMAIAPYVSWKKEGLKNILGRFVTMISVAMGMVGIFLLLPKYSSIGIHIEPGATVAGFWKGSTIPLQLAIGFLLLLCTFVAVTNLWRAIELGKRSKLGIGSFIAHFGMAVLLSGLIISKGLERTEIATVRDGTPGKALDYRIAFKDYNPDKAYDRNNVVKFTVMDGKGRERDITPNLYYYQAGEAEEAQTWPYIERNWDHDNYFFMNKPQVELWKEPLNIKPGETKNMGSVTVKYTDMTRKGEAGKVGVQFLANMEVMYAQEDGGPVSTYKASPSLTVTGQGAPRPDLPQLSPDFRIAILGMNAADKSVSVQLFFAPPLYQIQVFYKPLTCLVWIGTAIFTLGGFIAAFYRRSAVKPVEGDFVPETATIVNKDGNAPLATA